MAAVILKGYNESDNQYGPVRGADRLRNSRLVTSDPEAKKKRQRWAEGRGSQFKFHTPS